MIAQAAVSTPAPQRVLVYAFSFESSRSYAGEKAYGVDKMDPGGGGTFMFHNVNQHYRSPTFDRPQSERGSVAIRVVREEADGGLVFAVTDAPPGAAAKQDPVTCVAFGDTTVVCDPAHPVGPEVTVLLGLLGKGFVDASRLDSARHWHVDLQNVEHSAMDYTIVGSMGNLLEIRATGVRAVPGVSKKATVAATIEYDTLRSIPIAVDESTQQESRRGAISQTTATRLTIKLESDGTQGTT